MIDALHSYRDDFVRVTIDASPPQLRIALSGELDVATRDLTTTIADLDADPFAAVVVDLSGVEFVDSHGLQRLLDLRRQCSGAGLPVAFIGARPLVRKVFRAAGQVRHLGTISTARVD